MAARGVSNLFNYMPKEKRQVLVTVDFVVEVPDDFNILNKDDIMLDIDPDSVGVDTVHGGIVAGAQVVSYCTLDYVEEIHE